MATTESLSILDFPNEILCKIFKCLSYGEIAKKRITCKRFNKVGSDILDSEFQSLRNYTQQLFQAIKSQMPRRESARRKHALAHEYDIMETLNMRLTLLQMTFHKHIKQSHCCFFAGEVLDEVHRILIYLRTTPILERAHKVTDELFDLSTMAMEYFKEFIEPYLPDINYIGDYHFYDPYSSSSSSTSVAVNNSINSIDSIKDFGSYSTSEVNNDSIANEDQTLNENHSSESANQLTPAFANNENPITRQRIKQLERRSKYQVSLMKGFKNELKICKRKLNKSQATIKQYKGMLDEYEQKFETLNSKFENVLEELTKCKSEIQYMWPKPAQEKRPLLFDSYLPSSHQAGDLQSNKKQKSESTDTK